MMNMSKTGLDRHSKSRTGIVVLIAIASLALAGCASTAEPPPPEFTAIETEIATPTYEEAMQYYRDGQLELAAGAFQSIVREQPGHSDARYGLAEAARKLGAFDAAMPEFERLAGDPIHAAKANEGIALINLRTGQILLAKVAANTAIELDPDGAWRAWLVLARVNDYAEEWKASDEAYSKALSRSDIPSIVHNNIGVSLLARDRPSAASDQFERALRLDPFLESAQVNREIAYYLSNAGQPPSTEIDRRARARSFNNSGYIAMLRGNFDEAELMFQQAIDTFPAFYASAEQNMAALKTLQKDAGTDTDRFEPDTNIFSDGFDQDGP
jgi:Tfp pilus assembly protein PilF